MQLIFDRVVVDLAERTLRVAGEPVLVPPRAFEMLRVLLSHVDQPVSREALLSAVWPDTHTVPNSVSQAVGALRRALGEESGKRVQAVPGRGYRFVGPVVVLSTSSPTPPQPSTSAPPSRWTLPKWTLVAAAAIVIALLSSFAPLMLRRSDRRRPPQRQTNAALSDAMALLRTRRAADLRQAGTIFSRVVAADPEAVDGWIGLAQTEYLLGFYGLEDVTVASARANTAASRAIAIDPSRSRAYAVRASLTLDGDWNLAASARDFAQAVRLDPDDALAHHWSAWWCLSAGLLPEARVAMDRAVARDPFSAATLTARGTFAYLARDFASARADSGKALLVDPDYFRATLRLGLTDLADGQAARGIVAIEAAYRLAPDVPETSSALAHAYAVSGRKRDALDLFERTRPRLPLYDQAIVLTGLGRLDEAVGALTLARRRGQLVAGLFVAEPRLAPLRGLPAFERLASELAVPRRHAAPFREPPG